MTNPMLQCEHLSASYGARSVFTSASLSLPEGIYALQGANGSGKSTILRILAGAQRADGGEVWIDGWSLARSPQAARRRLSYVPDDSPIYPFVSGKELLQFVAVTKRATIDDDVARMVQEFDLCSQLDTRFDSLSLGTQKKILLCAAWIGTPKVILMDEPSNGLDRLSRESLIALLLSWHRRGTVLFATHDTDMVAATNAAVIEMDAISGRRPSLHSLLA